MATTVNYNKIFGIKRVIWNNESYYEQNSDIQNRYKQDVLSWGDYSSEELTEDFLADLWERDNEYNYEAERTNLDKDIDGYIIALGYRWSHYGSICGNGREGTKLVGWNIADILKSSGDCASWYAEDYNIHGHSGDHDGSWSIIYRVCKNSYEAEKLQVLAYEGKLTNADIMARTKSLYPYIAKIYGWPYRGSKKAA